jgi:hypothetical protein
MTLPSGLPEEVADEEDIARFLTSSGHYNSSAVKPAAFMPNPNNGETSVFRHGVEPVEKLREISAGTVGKERRVHGAGIVKAAAIRQARLEIKAVEPPARHADIIGWPWSETDRDFGKAEQKELATLIALKATGPLKF